MSGTPQVSVVIPSYQHARYIERAISSVREQDADLELIIADHSSTDGTWELVQQYADDPRVTLVRTVPGGGAPANWKAASDIARGRYLKLLPGDDWILPGSLSRQVALLENSPDAVLTAGRRDVVDAAGTPVVRNRGLGPLTRPVTGAEAIRATVRSGTNLFGEPGAVLLRRDAWTAAGGWDAEFPYAIDLATYIRVLERGDFIPDVATAAAFRLNAGQWSVALAREQGAQMTALHAAVHARLPDLVSPADARRGDRRARLLAHQRRLTYLLLKGRLA